MQNGFIMAKFHGMPIISHGRWYKKTKQKPGLSTQEKEGKKTISLYWAQFICISMVKNHLHC